MAGQNDFFVRFGSNADVFATKLSTDLDKVDARIARTKKLMEGLGGFSASGGSGGSGGGGGSHLGGDALSSEIASVLSDFKAMGAEVNVMLKQLGTAALAMGGITEAGKALQGKLNRASGHVDRFAAGNDTLRAPGTGRFATKDTPGAYRISDAAVILQRAMEKGSSTARTGIASITKTQLDTASVDRIVNAVKSVERAIKRGGTRVEGAPTQAGLQEAVAKAVATGLAAATGGGGKVSKVRKDAVETEALAASEGLSRAERKKQNQLNAQIQRDSQPTITKSEKLRRQAAQAALDLPGDEAGFRASVGRKTGQLSRADLVQIAKVFNEQTGSSIGTGKNVTSEKLIQGILGAHGAYAQSGFATRDDLRVGGKVTADDHIDRSVSKLIGPLGKLARSDELLAARLITSQNVTSGGDLNIPFKGRRAFGASVGPGQEGLVRQAEEQIVAFERLVLDFAAQQAKKSKFNPYDPAYSKGIGGTGEAPKGARQALGAVRRATQTIDDIYTEFAKGTKLGESQAREHSLSGLFATPEYRKGYYKRQGDYDPLFPGQGKSPRAQFEARGIDAAQRSQIAQILRESLGQAVAGGKAYAGSKKDIAREVPGLRFNRRTGYSFENEAIPVEKAKEIGKASDSYAHALQHLARVLQDEASTEEQHAKARSHAENKAEAFLNKVYGATTFAPPLQKFIGGDVQDPHNLAADQRRQAAIAKRNADNAAKKLTPEQQLAKAQESATTLAAALDVAAKEAKAGARKAATADAKLQAARDKLAEGLSAEGRAALEAARAELSAASKRRRQTDLTGSGSTTSQFAKAVEQYKKGIDLNSPATRFAPTPTAYVTRRLSAANAARDAEDVARAKIASILNAEASGEEQAAKSARKAAKDLEARREGLAKALANEQKLIEELQGKVKKVPAGAAKVVAGTTEVANPEREALIAQRRALAAQRADVNTQRKALSATDTSDLTRGQKGALTRKINQLMTRYNELLSEIEQIDRQIRGAGKGGGGRKGGGGTTGGTGAGSGGFGDGSTNGILKQILTAVNRVNTTLKGGVVISGTKGAGTTKTTAARPATGTSPAIPRYTDDERASVTAAVATRRSSQQQLRDIRNSQDAIRIKQEEARLESLRASAIQKTTAAEEQQARAALQLSAAVGRLDAASKSELATLERYSREGRSATAIAEQQAHAYLAVTRALAQQGASKGEAQSAAAKLIGGATGTHVTHDAIRDIESTAKSIHGYQTVDQAFASGVTPGGIFGEQSLFTKAMFGNHGFWSRIMSSTGTFVVRNFAAGFVFGMTNALQQVIKEAILTESTFVRVSGALEATGKDIGSLRSDLQQVSSDYGTNLNEIYQVAAGLAGLFKDSDQIASGTRVVSELETISAGALNATEAMGTLASITGAYGDELTTTSDGFQHVADVLTSVQNNIGANIEVTAEGVGRLSGLAKQLNISFEETAVYTAQIAKLTNQTGGAAGEQFSRILGALQTGRGQAAVTGSFTGPTQKSLEQSFGQGDYGGVLRTLLKNWDKLTAAQQRNIIVSVAGQRQAAAFAALFNNAAAVLNDVAKAENSDGDAKKRMDQITKTLNRQIAILGSNFQNLALNLVRSGLLDFLGIFLRLTNLLLGNLNKVLTKLNDFADANGFTKFMKSAAFAVIGFGLAAVVLRKSLIGLKATLAEVGAVQTFRTAAAGATTGRSGVSYLRPSTYLGIGRSAEPGLPTTKYSTRFSNYSTGLSDSAARAQERARLIGLFNTNASGGTISARADLQRMGYGAQARVQNAAAAAATRANAAMGKLGSGLKGMASSALAADIALAVVVAAIIAIAQEHSRQSNLKKEADTAYQSQFGSDRGKTPEEIAAESTAALGGSAQKAYEENKPGNFALGWSGLKGIAKGLTKTVVTGRTSALITEFDDEISKTLGTERFGNQQFGLDKANQIYGDALKKLVPGGSSDQILAVQSQFTDDIKTAADQINSDASLSGTQKVAALGALTQAQSLFKQQIADLLSVSEGVSSAMNISADGIQQLQSYFSTVQSLGGASNIGGLDISGILSDLAESTGITPGSGLARILDNIAKGNASVVQIAKVQKAFLAKEVVRLSALLKAAEVNGADESELSPIRSQLLATIQQLDQAGQGVIQAASDTANLQAGLATGAGNYARAISIYRKSITAGMNELRDAQSEFRAAKTAPIPTLPTEGAGPGGLQNYLHDLKRYNEAIQNSRGRSRAEMQKERALLAPLFAAMADALIQQKVRSIDLAIAQAIDPREVARLTQQRAAAVLGVYKDVQSQSGGLAGLDSQIQQATIDYYGAQKDNAEQAASNAQAQREAARETALARIPPGNALAIARQQLANARAAQADAAKFGTSSVEYQQATQQVIAAQWAIVQAQGDIAQANANLQRAYAEARGDTVGAARAGLRAAKAALAYARRLSGGARSADVINAQAAVVQAQAGARDAALQDRLDTIDFNLQIGKITQSSAIQALQQILKTADLTRQQRRDLLLKIKGMKDELANGQWNFGDIKLPTPYQMRRYIAERRAGVTNTLQQVADSTSSSAWIGSHGGGTTTNNYRSQVSIQIDGADVAKVKQIIREVVGTGANTRTSQARRGR